MSLQFTWINFTLKSPSLSDVHSAASLPPDTSSNDNKTWSMPSETRSASVSTAETQPAMELRSLPSLASPRWRRSSEIPGDVPGSPKLVGLKRIDSARRAELSGQVGSYLLVMVITPSLLERSTRVMHLGLYVCLDA